MGIEKRTTNYSYTIIIMYSNRKEPTMFVTTQIQPIRSPQQQLFCELTVNARVVQEILKCTNYHRPPTEAQNDRANT